MPCRLRQIDTSGRSPLSGICYGAAGFWRFSGSAITCGVFTPVLIALLMAYLFNPVIRQAEARWRIPRPTTIAPHPLWIGAAAAGAHDPGWVHYWQSRCSHSQSAYRAIFNASRNDTICNSETCRIISPPSRSV